MFYRRFRPIFHEKRDTMFAKEQYMPKARILYRQRKNMCGKEYLYATGRNQTTQARKKILAEPCSTNPRKKRAKAQRVRNAGAPPRQKRAVTRRRQKRSAAGGLAAVCLICLTHILWLFHGICAVSAGHPAVRHCLDLRLFRGKKRVVCLYRCGVILLF